MRILFIFDIQSGELSPKKSGSFAGHGKQRREKNVEEKNERFREKRQAEECVENCMFFEDFLYLL